MNTVAMRGITTVDLEKRTRRRRGYLNDDEISYDAATVIAIDPGGTTGWSLISVHPGSLVETSFHTGISTDGEFSGVYDLAKFIHTWPCAAVVVEDFTLNQFRRDRDLLSPVRITAALGYCLWRSGRDYHVQSPGDAKRICSDERLKEWRMYDPVGSLVHARDADRHALLFLRKCKARKDFRAMAFPHLYGERGAYIAG